MASQKDESTRPLLQHDVTSAPERRGTLLKAIAHEEERLRRLEADQTDVKTHLAALQNELAGLNVGATPPRRRATPLADGPPQ